MSDQFARDTNRLEAFSDGVFAIAITILGIEMKIPAPGAHDGQGLGMALLEQWPVYVSFLISFLIILVIWLSHHQLFKLVHSINRPFFFANGLLLCAVTVIPFTTNIVAEYFLTAYSRTAIMVYSLISFPVGFSFVFMLNIIRRHTDIRKPEADPVRLDAWLRRMWYTSGFFVSAFAFSFFLPVASLAIIFFAAVFWGVSRIY